VTGVPCSDCGAAPASFTITGVGVLCDRCADRYLSARMGLPLLPDPPDPVVIRGPDGHRHTLRFRLWRAPTGVSVELHETRSDQREGYEFAVLGAHDGDVEEMISRVLAIAHDEIGRSYLRRDRQLGRWTVGDGDEVAGRLTYDPDGGPCRVVVDGRVLSWDEFGHALASYEGWRFRLSIADPAEDLRPNAQIIPLPPGVPGPGRPLRR
jgi:hypothetical protein